MSDPLTTFDLVAIGAVIVALVAAVTALWKAFTNQVNELKKQAATRDAENKTEMLAVVKRVRLLEDERVTEAKAYASKLEDMNRQQTAVFSRTIAALQDITRAVSEWTKRPCLADGVEVDGKLLKPITPLPMADTELIMKHHEKVVRRQQEESGAA